MLVDMLIVGGLIYGLAKALNATAFKVAPAKPWIAWSLTVVAWVASFIALFIGRVLAYKSIAAEVGVPSLASTGPKPSFFLPFLFAYLFFVSLNRKQKDSGEPAAQASDTLSPEQSPKTEPAPTAAQRGGPKDGVNLVVDRLKELQQLRDRGILTEAEYQSKLKATLDQA